MNIIKDKIQLFAAKNACDYCLLLFEPNEVFHELKIFRYKAKLCLCKFIYDMYYSFKDFWKNKKYKR